ECPQRHDLSQFMLSAWESGIALQQSEGAVCSRPLRQKQNPGRATRPGLVDLSEPRVRSVSADVDGAQAIAERSQHRTRHIAAVVGIVGADHVDAEAAEVMMKTTETVTKSVKAAKAEAMRRSGRGSQRHGAEGGCGNQSKSEFA